MGFQIRVEMQTLLHAAHPVFPNVTLAQRVPAYKKIGCCTTDKNNTKASSAPTLAILQNAAVWMVENCKYE